MKQVAQLTIMLIIVVLALAPFANAGVPQMINYQGRLTNSTGNPVPDSDYQIVFTIYDTATGGIGLWYSGIQTVNVENGLFTYQLGSVNPLPDDIFTDTLRWLGIKVGSDDEISPRTRLTSVPYAYQALRADTADYAISGGGGGGGWIDDGAVVRLDTSTDEVGVGTVSPDAKLHVEATQVHAGRFTSSVGTTDSAVFTAEYLGGGDVDAVAVHGISRANDYWGIGGRFEGNYMGLEAIAHTGTNPSAGYTGVRAKATGGNAINCGLRASADSCAGATGVYGAATNATEWCNGVEGIANSGSSTVSTGVFATASGSSFMNLGVSGSAFGSGGTWAYAVNGEAHGASAGNIGVEATANENSGWKRGVNGSATGSGDNYGVFGGATDAAGTNNYGVYGTAYNASNLNYAGYFDGDVHINGVLSKSGGSFKIDHPLDQENKYLQHSFVESPDMMNVYNGNVVTDTDSRAVVEMPDYFEALNTDFRYQLTVIGEFAQAIVLEKIQDSRFIIMTDKPNIEVSWQVTGVRQDPWAQAHRIEVEVDKLPFEQGKYLNPELYGFDKDRAIHSPEEAPQNPQIPELTKQAIERDKK